jgi:hypothetical protein
VLGDFAPLRAVASGNGNSPAFIERMHERSNSLVGL